MEILSLIAWKEEKLKKENGLKLLEPILEKEGRRKGTYYSRTAIINRNLVMLLKNNKKYKESYNLALKNINNIFLENEAGILINMLDYISTIDEELGNKSAASEICKNLFYISELYGRYDTAKVVKEYFEKNFDKNEVWY